MSLLHTQTENIMGALLYYGRAVDNKLLPALSAIGTQQATATENTKKAAAQLLDYVATYPADNIVFRTSRMQLCAHSDAGIANESLSRSCAGAHIFLADDNSLPRWNGLVVCIAAIIKT